MRPYGELSKDQEPLLPRQFCSDCIIATRGYDFREGQVDLLAPAVGNMHGMLTSMVQGQTRKRLDIQRIAQIKSAAQVPLTLHGGSGTDDEDLRKAIAAGINIIHINTELRVAWRRGLEEGLAKQPHEVVPYKILPFAVESVKEVARSRLRLFNADR
jgi:fructose-bisphosphate aldolase, class II